MELYKAGELDYKIMLCTMLTVYEKQVSNQKMKEDITAFLYYDDFSPFGGVEFTKKQIQCGHGARRQIYNKMPLSSLSYTFPK